MIFTSFDEDCMRRALRLARKGEGRVEPNPMVGCVLAREGRIISEGFHHRFGGPHAEVLAIRAAKTSLKGATAYVTLEPCCHIGKTPPCTEAIVTAGISRVIAALRDPFTKVAGKGLAVLRSKRITTHVGLCSDEAQKVLAPYLKRILTRTPYVILKWAQSLDGKIATSQGDSKWISSEESRKEVHRLRARVDAILVGVGTVLADDPLLTARDVPLKRMARRIVVDSQLRTPPTARLFKDAVRFPLLIATTARAMQRRPKLVRLLQTKGAEIVAFRERAGRIALPPLLRHLARAGATNLLVEGGGELLSSFLDERLADEAWIFQAPCLIGGPSAPPAYGGLGSATVKHAVRPSHMESRRSGPDQFLRLWFASG